MCETSPRIRQRQIPLNNPRSLKTVPPDALMLMLGSGGRPGQDDRHRDAYDFSLTIHSSLNQGAGPGRARRA
jgi:hypothetical protein